MASRRVSTRSVIAAVALVAAILPGARPVAAATPAPLAVDSFEASPPGWSVVAGTATVSTTSTKTAGSLALDVQYDLTGGNVELGTIATPKALPDGILTTLSVDVYGDHSYNTLFVRLRDATGEALMYPVGAMSFSGWQTMTVDLAKAPAFHDQGNNDGVLDAPVSLYRWVLARNGSQPATGRLTLDNVVAGGAPWTLPTASRRVFVPSAGQATTVSFTPSSAGDYRLQLIDGNGATKTFDGTAVAGHSVALSWNGSVDGGGTAGGNIRSVLRYDASPGNGLGTVAGIAALPYLTGAALRVEGSAPASIVGVNSFLTTITDSVELDRQARLMEDASVRMAREEFEWKRVEPRKGWFDWARFDAAVEVARSHQISVLGKLVYSAPWASSAPAGTSASTAVYYPPKNVADFAAYAKAVVHRYKDRVHVWEIWNEPNTPIFWKPSPSGTAYASLLKAAASAIRAEDPTATIVLGGLAGFDKPFLDAIRAAGAWSSFDALGIHTYVSGPPEGGTGGSWLDRASAYVERYGTKAIWITELGWSTYSGSGTGYIGVSETNQANYLSRAYLDAAARGIAGIFWYDLVEDGTSSTSVGQNYGLTERSGRLKPAYSALRQVGAVLDQAVSAGPLAPTNGTSAVVDGAESTSGWAAYGINGASGSLATTTSSPHGGSRALQLTYNVSGSGTGVELRRTLKLPGTPGAISIWVSGDDSAGPVYLKFTDATGEYFQGAVGTAARKSWQRLTLYLDGGNPNWKHWSGDNDGRIDYPITFRSVYLYEGLLGVTSGTVRFDDLTASPGLPVRGVAFAGGNWNTQAAYRLGTTTSTPVAVANAPAFRRSGASFTQVTVSSGRTTVALGQAPLYVVSAAGLSAASFTPNGDGVGDVVSIRWIGGDRSQMAFQVYRGSTFLRTVTALSTVDAALRSQTWDGRWTDGAGAHTATTGSYVLRLTIRGPDGRQTVLSRTVTVP